MALSQGLLLPTGRAGAVGPPPQRRTERNPALREPEFWLPLPGKESSHAHRSHIVYGCFQATLAELRVPARAAPVLWPVTHCSLSLFPSLPVGTWTNRRARAARPCITAA